jgi:hypothetical protein
MRSIAVDSPTNFQPQKSKPRNGAGEILVTAVAEIRRETVSAANSLTRPPRRTPPIRDKIDSSRRIKRMQYQLLRPWLGRQDSNLGMAESKFTCSAFPFNGHFEKTEKFAPFPINRLAPMSECVVRASRALWRFLFHRRYRRAPASLGCSRRRHGRVWVVTSRCIVRSRMGRLSARRWSDHHDRYPASDRTGRWRRS